ncbi:zinc transporter ZupT [Bradyrhizobium sp. GM0.4]
MISSIAAMVGYAFFSGFSTEVIAGTEAVAAGAILAMLADTMVPEAFDVAHDYVGLITVAGFLCSFALTKFNG